MPSILGYCKFKKVFGHIYLYSESTNIEFLNFIGPVEMLQILIQSFRRECHPFLVIGNLIRYLVIYISIQGARISCFKSHPML